MMSGKEFIFKYFKKKNPIGNIVAEVMPKNGFTSGSTEKVCRARWRLAQAH
jgi:hypothetical protein